MAIIEAIKAIPPGRAASYGSIAKAVGLSNGARMVVRILHARSRQDALPWHRVVKADGSIALAPGQGFELQAGLLKTEGVEFIHPGRVDLSRCGFY